MLERCLAMVNITLARMLIQAFCGGRLYENTAFFGATFFSGQNMKIQTHHIPSSGLDLEFEEKPERFASVKGLMDRGECDFVTPVAIALQVTPGPEMIRVKGLIGTTTRQACVRCLERFDRALESPFILDYSKTITTELHRSESDPVELTAQKIGMMHYQGDEIDFADAIQEQIILALPYRPLCNDDCKGLCAQCGRNLNLEDCRCKGEDTGGPFDVLKSLKLPSE